MSMFRLTIDSSVQAIQSYRPCGLESGLELLETREGEGATIDKAGKVAHLDGAVLRLKDGGLAFGGLRRCVARLKLLSFPVGPCS